MLLSLERDIFMYGKMSLNLSLIPFLESDDLSYWIIDTCEG